ncbi:hypothetical protein AZA_73812 [Nitrospirillum viridazoti Y2]|nr:hypothetical protein AZA_73812 [Nitrospirillum amazonense Y2]
MGVAPDGANLLHPRRRPFHQAAAVQVRQIELVVQGGVTHLMPHLHPPPLQLLALLLHAVQDGVEAEAFGVAPVTQGGVGPVGGPQVFRGAAGLLNLVFDATVFRGPFVDVHDHQAQHFQ